MTCIEAWDVVRRKQEILKKIRSALRYLLLNVDIGTIINKTAWFMTKQNTVVPLL